MISRALSLLLLLVFGLIVVTPGRAQPPSRRGPIRSDGGRSLPVKKVTGEPELPSDKISHRPLTTGLEDVMSPEDAMAKRLLGSRNTKQLQDELAESLLPGEIQKFAERLLKDEKFLESLGKRFSREDARSLLGKVQRGDGLGNEALRKMLEEGFRGMKLEKDDRDLLRKWKDKIEQQGDDAGPGKWKPPVLDKGTGPSPIPPDKNVPLPSTDGATPPGTLPWDQGGPTPEWFRKRVDRWINNLDRWVDSPSGKSWRDALKNAARRLENNRAGGPDWGAQVRRISRFVPRLSDYAPGVRMPRISGPRLPNLPRVGSLPSAPSVTTGSMTGSGKVLVVVAALGIAAFLLWRAGGWYERLRQVRGAAWRPGPWPVQPDQVRTRGELVRAFEHLALVELGREARTCNHLDLGEQMGSRPSLDPDRRRDAASTLARLYEQARYVPDEESLPAEEMARARRELSYLAGVAAA